jgi:hypothetical protein
LRQSARFWRAKSLNTHCFATLFWEPSKLKVAGSNPAGVAKAFRDINAINNLAAGL